jgi:hypothetical protein
MSASGTLRRVGLARTDVSEGIFASFLRSDLRLLVNANAVPTSPTLVTLMMEAIFFSLRSDLIRATRRHIPADGILLSHRRENLKSYILPISFSFYCK